MTPLVAKRSEVTKQSYDHFNNAGSSSIFSHTFRLLASAIFLLTLLFCAAQPLEAHPAFNIRNGLSALQQGNLEQAETELQRARFAEPDNPVIAYNLGVVSYRRRDYQKAAGFFMQAASAAGKDAEMRFDSLYNLGNAAFKAGDYAAAVSAYSSSVEVKADQKAAYNLEIARKKLEEQQKKEQQQKQDQKDQQKQDQKDQQKQDQKGQQDKSDQQSGEKSGQKGDQSQENQKSEEQKDSESKSDTGDQQKDGQKDNQKDQQKQGEQGDQKKGEESDSDQQQASKPSAENEEQTASQSQQLNEQTADNPSENRQDVDMGADNAQQTESQKPDASQRARALKNVKINPYQVERLLQQMQERERQAQLHYRNEPQRNDEADPFDMNAQQLNEWFENRSRPRSRQQADEPDW